MSCRNKSSFVAATKTASGKHEKGTGRNEGEKTLSQTVGTNLQRGWSVSVISTGNLLHGDSVSLIPKFILGMLLLSVRERPLNST